LLSLQHFGRDFGVFSEFGDENVFSHVAGIAGGVLMTKAISITLLIATVGSGMGSQLGAARCFTAWVAAAQFQEVLRSHSSHDANSRQQRDFCGGDRTPGSVSDQL
jgi:amino acid transporter